MASYDSSEVRFAAYVAALVDVIGHADRVTPLRDYCTGLLMPAARKSVEPIAAVTAPARVAAQHQSLLHFVGISLVKRLGRMRPCSPRCATCPTHPRGYWAHRGLDHRRYGLSQEGPALGRGGAPV